MFRLAVVDRTRGLVAPVWAAARALDPIPELREVPTAEFDHADLQADVLFLGPGELTGTGLRRLQRWRQSQPDAVVLARLDGTSPPTTVLREHGIDAWWQGHTDAELVTPLLTEALHRIEVAREAAELEIPVEPESAADPGFVISIASATGGCGKTFFATNLAATVGATGKRTLLIDLDLQFGEVDAALQARPRHSIYDGFYDAYGQPLEENALADHLGQLVHDTGMGFDLLAAPREPALADYLTAEDAQRAVLVAAEKYDVVVIDTPPALSDITLAALDFSDVVAVLATLDVPSLRNLRSFLDVMTALEISDDRLRLLLNRVEDDIGIDVSQAQGSFGNRFVAQLPANKAASRSINTGQVVVRSEPRSPLARALAQAIDIVLPEDVLPRQSAPDPTSESTPSRWQSLFRRHRSSAATGGTP